MVPPNSLYFCMNRMNLWISKIAWISRTISLPQINGVLTSFKKFQINSKVSNESSPTVEPVQWWKPEEEAKSTHNGSSGEYPLFKSQQIPSCNNVIQKEMQLSISALIIWIKRYRLPLPFYGGVFADHMYQIYELKLLLGFFGISWKWKNQTFPQR